MKKRKIGYKYIGDTNFTHKDHIQHILFNMAYGYAVTKEELQSIMGPDFLNALDHVDSLKELHKLVKEQMLHTMYISDFLEDIEEYTTPTPVLLSKSEIRRLCVALEDRAEDYPDETLRTKLENLL